MLSVTDFDPKVETSGDFLNLRKTLFSLLFLLLQLKRKRMRGELSKPCKKWPRYRLLKFIDCPTFFTIRRVHWVLGWWHRSRSLAPWDTALPRAVNTRVRSSGRSTSCMRVNVALIDPLLLVFILGKTNTFFRIIEQPTLRQKKANYPKENTADGPHIFAIIRFKGRKSDYGKNLTFVCCVFLGIITFSGKKNPYF